MRYASHLEIKCSCLRQVLLISTCVCRTNQLHEMQLLYFNRLYFVAHTSLSVSVCALYLYMCICNVCRCHWDCLFVVCRVCQTNYFELHPILYHINAISCLVSLNTLLFPHSIHLHTNTHTHTPSGYVSEPMAVLFLTVAFHPPLILSLHCFLFQYFGALQ